MCTTQRLAVAAILVSMLAVPWSAAAQVAARDVTVEDLGKFGTWKDGLNTSLQDALATVDAYLATHPLTQATQNRPDALSIYGAIYEIWCWEALTRTPRDWQRVYDLANEFCTMFPQAGTQRAQLLFQRRMNAIRNLWPERREELAAAAQAAADRLVNGEPTTGTFAHLARDIAEVLAESTSPQDALEYLQQLGQRQACMILQPKYWDGLVDTYLLLNMKPEAQQAAMSWFHICPYRRADVKDAVTRLLDTFGPELTDEKLDALAAYLDTGQGENPFPDVKPLEVPPEQIGTILVQVWSHYDRQVISLYGGRFREALELTAQMVTEGSMEPWEIGRCIKAEDGHLARANQWIEFARTGQGDDPLASYEVPLAVFVSDKARAPLQSALPNLDDPNGWTGTRSVAGVARTVQILRLLNERRMDEEQFVAWVDARGIEPQVLVRTLEDFPIKWPMEPGYRAICAAIYAKVGEDIDTYLCFPPQARLIMAMYLGVLEREDDVKKLVATLPPTQRFDVHIPQYLVASQLYVENKLPLVSIWAWKLAAQQLGGTEPPLIASYVQMMCRKIGDPDVVRQELIPWAEDALAIPGSEPNWSYAVPSLVWGYTFIGEPEKALERGQHWLEQARARNVLDDRLEARTKAEMALAQIGAGQYEAAKQALREAILNGPEYTAERIHSALTEAAQSHPEIGDIEPLPPQFQGMGGGGQLLRVTSTRGEGFGFGVFGNAAFEVTGATCDLALVEVTVGDKKLEGGRTTYQVQIVAHPTDRIGMHQGIVTITTNDPNQPEVKLPVAVDVRKP